MGGGRLREWEGGTRWWGREKRKMKGGREG